jgi:hypothetical protein
LIFPINALPLDNGENLPNYDQLRIPSKDLKAQEIEF